MEDGEVTPKLLLKKHQTYFERSLVMFPAKLQDYDSSHLALVYFCILGLAVLELTPSNVEEWEEWVWNRLVPSKVGYRGSQMHRLGGDSDPQFESQDFAHIDSTFFALSILALLKSANPSDKIDSARLLSYLELCQTDSGLFCAGYTKNQGPIGEASLRHTFSAIGIMKLLGLRHDVVEQKVAAAVSSLVGYDGGFGDFIGSESHAGLTYCALGSLTATSTPGIDGLGTTVSYLANCQLESGGFNGRPNKPADVCYSYWAGASLSLLGRLDLIDRQAARLYLLANGQNILLGGFSKLPGEFPDPLHSALSLCALSLFGQPGLSPIDPMLCLPEDSVKHIGKKWHMGQKTM